MNGLIAIVSLLMALFYGPMEVVEYVVGFEVTPCSVAVNFDPVFLCWSDSIPAAGMAWGNTIVMNEMYRGTWAEPFIFEHEMNHVRQWQALGWTMWPVAVFGIKTIEPYGTPQYPTAADCWADMRGANDLMWKPEGKPNWYHFLSLQLKLGG